MCIDQINKYYTVFKVLMTLQQLQYVVALDTHRHFVRAAESCHVSQPTLTLQVKKLEGEIGMLIFDRSTMPLTPTPMGEQFILRARQILREVDSLKALVNEDRHTLKGTFRIGIIPTVAPYLLPRFLKHFSDAFPEVNLEIKEIQSEQIIHRLHHNTLDIGILATPLSDRALREIPIYHEPFLIYAHENDPMLNKQEVRSEDIHHKGLWLLDQGHCFRNQVLNICQHQELVHSDRIVFETGSIETLKNMIQSHSGYTLIPELAVRNPMDKPYVRRFVEPQPAREISLVVHQSFTKELLLTNLRKSIVERIPDDFRSNNRMSRIEWR